MLYYRLAELNIAIECENEYLINRMKPFQTEPAQDINMSICIRQAERLDEPTGEVLIADKLKLLRKPNSEEGYILYITGGHDDRTVLMKMDASADWSVINLDIVLNHNSLQEGMEADSCEYLYPFAFCGIAFRNMLMHKDGLVIHSSSIAFRGKGIIFTAPSGTGKSTHVNLWEETFGKEVTVINDDTPAIRFIDGVPMLSGTPWSGSSDKFTNLLLPLNAIVVLEQYPENVIRKLTPIEAMPMLVPMCYLPFFDKESTVLAYDLIEKLLVNVNLYHLRCLPDQGAVELVYQCAV